MSAVRPPFFRPVSLRPVPPCRGRFVAPPLVRLLLQGLPKRLVQSATAAIAPTPAVVASLARVGSPHVAPARH